VQIVKNTSLTAIIGFTDLTRAAQLVNNATFQPFIVFGWAAAIYFALCFPLSALSRRLERKLNAGRRSLVG
jgi:polar amino acid transport system permease protein